MKIEAQENYCWQCEHCKYNGDILVCDLTNKSFGAFATTCNEFKERLGKKWVKQN